MSNGKGSAGFTLIEVLVVVAIIGIITVMAVPAYKNTMIRTKRSRMLTTMKTISDDMQLYYSDTGQFYPEGFSFGSFTFAFEVYYPSDPIHLKGQGSTLSTRRHYVYYLYRFEPFYSEPLIYAYALKQFGNDLDGDPYPDLWIKTGSGSPQVYYDDLKDSRHTVVWN